MLQLVFQSRDTRVAGDAPPYRSHKFNGAWVYRGDFDAALTNQIEVLASRCSSDPDGSDRTSQTSV